MPRLLMPADPLELASGPTDPIKYYVRPLVGVLFRRRLEVGLELLERHAGTQLGDVLELGYGNGVMLLNLKDRARSLTGLDLDADPERMTRLLKDRGITAALHRGDAGRMPFAAASFDTLVAFSIFEHVKDFGAIFSECRRVLRPDGWLLIGMPSVNRAMEAAFLAIGYRGIAHHHVTTPRAVLEGLRGRQDFRLLDYRTMPRRGPLPLYHCMIAQARPGGG